MDGRIIHPAGIRFAAHYGAFYIAFGAFLPYLPVWLEARSLSSELIGIALAGGMIGRTLLAPVGAAWMDSASRRRDAVIGFAWAGLAGFLLMSPFRDAALLTILAALAGALFSAQIPLMDAFAAWSSRKEGFAFGPQRAFGSAMFIIGNIATGALISRYGGEAALVWMTAGAALAVAAAYFLPVGERDKPAPGTDPIPFSLLLTPPFMLALGASALIQSSHGFYYVFSAIAWQAQGIPAETVGVLWSTGVLAEIIFLTVSGRYLMRFQPGQLMLIAAAAAVIRWSLTAMSPALPLLFLLQISHALTFAAAYLGILRFAADNAPDRLQASTQAANSALSGGIALAAVSALSGPAYDHFGTAGFAFMAIPAAAGGICALLLLRRRTP
ncbi:MFS transporter [Hyphobacterium sp. HN65]|uniref:MFS transporter n=1 Tax=Hyphobacterium lacteum TaxID=3116575 RepID=A0ABU7LQS1_9PROT|nr:MFS transporter [Hyphobacterium sp. HN65]MEE2526257.1 MFS transporter [Hyphobacterium sp. HN65]